MESKTISTLTEPSGLAIEISKHTELLRWWHRYQAQLLNQETDFVRNGLLQEIIAQRRRLEVACHTHPTSQPCDCHTRLAEMQRLYELVEDFCDRLESPYQQDSLPLALQCLLQPWVRPLNLATHLAPTWDAEPIEQTRLLLLLTKTLLNTLNEIDRRPLKTLLTLVDNDGCKQFGVQAEYESPLALTFAEPIEQALQPFLDTFRLLAQADCDQMFQTHHFSLKLSWRSPALAPS
ncbi:MAG: hypothetical protein AAF283_02890 [Cyanobacteria bacterium P01_A01_bin.70]